MTAQQLLFQHLRENLPADASVADEVASLLYISTDSAVDPVYYNEQCFLHAVRKPISRSTAVITTSLYILKILKI